MKNKFLIVALIGILLAAGMVLVSCGSKCVGDDDCKIDIQGGVIGKWCLTKVSDSKDLSKARECAVYKEYEAVGKTDKKADCDC